MNSNSPEGTAERYFVRIRGKILGPFTVDKLKSLRSRGQFSRAHEFSTDRATWQPAAALDPLLGFGGAGISSAAAVVDELPLAQPAPVPPAAVNAGPLATWHYNAGGERHGPVSILDLRELIRRKLLGPDDYVWKEGMADWSPIVELPELQALVNPATALPQGVALGSDGIHHTSGFAVASLVLGILGMLTFLLPVFSLLAVIFGAVALKAISKSRTELGGRGMALSGLVLGIVGLSLLGIAIILRTPQVMEFFDSLSKIK